VRAAASPLVIFLAALALRAGFAFDYIRHFPRQALATIPFLFESGNIAHSLATGGGFGSPFHVNTGPTAWMTPLYPYLLASLMRLFGPYTFASYLAAVALNITASSLACVPLYFAGWRIGGVRLAALSAWLWAIFPNAILLTFQSLWDTSLSALLGAALLWGTLRVAASKDVREWSAYGLLWGVALMTNASFLSLLPFLLGWAAWRSRVWNSRGKEATLALAVTVICCVPWTVRNYVVFHSLIPLRSVLGLQLWVGNNAQAKVQWLGEQHPIHDTGEREKYVAMGEIAYMHEKLEGALSYIFSHPGREAELIGGRFISLWTGGSLTPVEDFRSSRSVWFRYVLVFNIASAVAALAGIVLLFRAGSVYAVPVSAYAIVFPCAYYMTLALPRYRSPIDPVLMLLTAMAGSALWAQSRQSSSVGVSASRARSSASKSSSRSGHPRSESPR
jgi:4-amino-4-deoxy-L-arabinose transferase-like glycosyltransferase